MKYIVELEGFGIIDINQNFRKNAVFLNCNEIKKLEAAFAAIEKKQDFATNLKFTSDNYYKTETFTTYAALTGRHIKE